MKNKPTAHKLSNRFQFKSFNEQLTTIEIKYGRYELKNRHLYEDSEESNFLKTLQKWEDLNCTQDFVDLKCKIGPFVNVTNLAQVVHRKNDLIDILKSCLQNRTSQCLDVALDLVIALAFDLRKEFYPYFMEIFDCLINLLEIQESALLENVFMCFAYMFKSLWRYILNDFHTVLIRFSHKLLARDRKDYIKNFAAQSFSFLMRKVDDKDSLLQLLFGHLEKHRELTEGIGYLLFETVKGVHQQLHSSASKFLLVLLHKVTNDRWMKSDNIFEAIKHCFTCLTKYLTKDTSEVVWNSVCTVIQKSTKSEPAKKVCEVLRILLLYKNCSLVYNSEAIISILQQIMLFIKDDEECVKIWLDCASLLLRNLNSSMSLKVISNFMKMIFSSSFQRHYVDYFVNSLISYVFFERDVLPYFLSYFSDNFQYTSETELFSSLKILVEIIIKKCRRSLLGSDLTSKVYTLHIPKLRDADKFLTDILLDIVDNCTYLPLVWSALICLPHVKPNANNRICEIVATRLQVSLSTLSDATDRNTSMLELIVLESVFSSFLFQSTVMFDLVDCNKFISALRSRMNNAVILQAFDFYLESANRFERKDILELNYFESIYDELKVNLSSFCRSIRLLSLHISLLFNPTLPATESPDIINESVFRICLDAEKVPVSVGDYREKLRILQKLECGSNSSMIPIEAVCGYSYELTPVYSLFGALFSNLSLLWSPINKIVEQYVRSLKNTEYFWQTLLQHYSKTTQLISSEVSNSYIFDEPLVNAVFEKFYELHYRFKEDRPDYYNHRVQLLKLMQLLADVVEKKNRDFVNLFFQFLDNETSVINLKRDTFTEDISLDSNVEKDTELSDCNRKMIWKTLISFLEVFSNFRNPKALYKEPEVHSIFNSLLQHKDCVVQKATFNCILAYSFSFLSPYKENFLRLIDNNTFKSEIVNFSLNPSNEEDRTIKDEHRSDLMPYLMRILYGKMLSKTGPNTSGHTKSTLRRSIVFRFLAGCPDNELNLFITLAFASFNDVFNLDLVSVVDHYKEIDIKRCIPIRKALSCLKTLEVMLFNLGNITKKLLPDFFKILIAIASFVTNLLNQRNLIKEAAVAKVKVLRGECLKLSARFFEVFDEYNYSKMEIEQFFNVVVLPLLPKLSNESLSSPSPLLKLLIVWSENPRYFVLLMKKMKLDVYPLSVVIDLYSDTKCNDSVIEAISAMLVNILTLDNFERMETETGELIDSIEADTVTETNDFNDSMMSYGKFILNPFTGKIISRIKLNFDNRCKFKKRKKLLMTSNELTILTEIAPFVKDESQCKILAKLLVETFAEKQKRSIEVECQTLETIYSLVKETTTTEDDFIASFIPLFRFIVERNSRLELCKILSSVKNNADIAILGDSISMLNSYNPMNPEEPDFGVRMNGFKLIKDCIDSIVATNNIQILNLLVYNCCFFIASVDDLGIREASSDLIQLIVQKLNDCGSTALFSKVCIEVLLLKEIRIGLRSKSEQTRDENIVLLSFLARNCSDKHPFLKQLNLLCDEDDEVDFYTTIRHIQLYRRSRTLHRFVKNVDILEKLSSRVLSSYIIPILTGFLFDSHCRKNSGLTDASIEALGAICGYIAWPVYQKMLEHYLNVLVKDFENHKMIVKILTTILNNFKFDLTHTLETENTMDTEEANKKKTAAAKKIYDYIVSDLLPKLHKHLHTFSRSDYEYDSMKDEYPEDNEIQRVPLAFAIVKLLKALPQQTNIIEANVPSVFLRLLHFLKSKSEVIRQTARNSLVKVMQSLGPQFFPYLLREMQSVLKKGYQVHVLTYTLHSVISGLQSQLNSGDFDSCLESVVDICVQEIFSDIAEEKQVAKITAKVKEARKSKSFDTFYCVACFASEQTLSRIIVPLKNVLFECNNHKVLRKVSRCIQKVVFGLTENSSLSESCLLTFFYGIVHGLIPELSVSNKRESSSSKLNESDYLLVEKPSKKEKKIKSKISTNRFILVQECFHILHILLKKDRLKSTNAEHVALLEPFISFLSDFIVSNHPKLSTMALKCLNLIILRFSTLESFKTYANTIKNNLFVLMHKHTGIGMQQGENYDLVIMLFKTMHYLISEIEFVQLDEKQLEVLLVYCEKDIYENSRQAVAFAMLKAIITRRLQSPALKEIMTKLAEMLVQSHQDYVRKQCIQIWMRYLTDFPHGKNLRNHLMFFIRQLDYEHETGRLAVLELLMSVVSRFPDVFNSYIDLLFIPVASRLINEESKRAKDFACDVITKIFHRADLSKRNSLFNDVILSWFQHSSILQKQLAVRLLVLLSDVEQEQFKKRFYLIIPLLRKNLDACIEAEDNNAELSTPEDHLVYQLLFLFLRLLKIEGNLSKSAEFSEDIFAILKSVNETYLSHAHLWVRIVSVEIFEELFSLYSVDEVSCAMNESKSCGEYILSNTPLVMWNLCSKFLDLLRNVGESDSFGAPLIKNMLFIAKVFIRTPDSWESNEELCFTKMNIKWLISRMIREVRREVSENEKCYVKRTLIFKWIAAIVLELNNEQLSSSVEVLLIPLCREVSSKRNENEKVDSNLINLVEDVLKVIRGAVGKDSFNNSYAKIISIQNRRRLHRKNQRTIELIVNPLKGLKRKHKKHVAFRENKKRKIAEKKGKVVKKRRVS